MPANSNSDSRRCGKAGNFAASRNRLLAHFNGAGSRNERKWREVFGLERKPEKVTGGKPFNAREAPRSSSDS